jgi:hypothetical protein
VSKKGDARIARALKKKLEQEKKSARLREWAAADLPTEKRPRLGADPGSIFDMQMDWHCNSADRIDTWSWGQEREWGAVARETVILPKLSEYEKLLWKEIDRFVTPSGHKAHHAMAVDNIDAEPRTRLERIQLEHDEDIFRFRLGAKRRLWGFRVANVFEILWYDPLHMIYRLDPE